MRNISKPRDRTILPIDKIILTDENGGITIDEVFASLEEFDRNLVNVDAISDLPTKIQILIFSKNRDTCNEIVYRLGQAFSGRCEMQFPSLLVRPQVRYTLAELARHRQTKVD